MKIILSTVLLSLVMLIIGCSQETVANRGFSLPEGDAENGQFVFMELRCIECHTLAGTDLSQEEWRLYGERETTVALGGETTKCRPMLIWLHQ